MSSTETFDIIIIGAGLVGLSSAFTLAKLYPGLKIAVLEKEAQISAHQSGRNSGVIHSRHLL
jgi:L-2-hydroxyglutarate oxidase